jgi:hypothetical protein
MTIPPDYYEILQVSPNAEDEIIQAAYRRLAQKWHPDRRPGDPSASEHMKLLNEAYEVLSDSQKRQEYDSRRTQSAAGRQAAEQRQRAEEDRKRQQDHQCQKAERGRPRPASLPEEPCWFCKKNEANGKPAAVELSLKRGGGLYQVTNFNVPRCELCQLQHMKYYLFFWGPTAIGASLILLGIFLSYLLDRSAYPDWLTACSLALAVLGLFWASFWRLKWLESTVADFPSIRALLDARWEFGIPLNTRKV